MSYRCPQSQSINELHAHLIGSNCVDHGDVLPSALCCIGHFIIAGASIYVLLSWSVETWFFRPRRRYWNLAEIGLGALAIGIGFAVRAAIANTSWAKVTRSSVLAEQVLFVMGQILQVDGIVCLARNLLPNLIWGHEGDNRMTIKIISRLFSAVAGILYIVSYTKLPDTPPTLTPVPMASTQLRVGGATLIFALAILDVAYLPFEKIKYPTLRGSTAGMLFAAAFFQFWPAFYTFVITVVTDDTSPLNSSRLFFYLTFSLAQILSPIPMLLLTHPFAWLLYEEVV